MTEPNKPRVSDNRLTSMVAFGLGLMVKVSDGELREMAANLLTCRRELAEARAELQASPVTCGCHPGVRWTIDTWGLQCPLSKVERDLLAARARIAELEQAAGAVLIAWNDLSIPGDEGDETLIRLAKLLAATAPAAEAAGSEEREK
jgi:hypothetical protein